MSERESRASASFGAGLGGTFGDGLGHVNLGTEEVRRRTSWLQGSEKEDGIKSKTLGGMQWFFRKLDILRGSKKEPVDLSGEQ